MEPLFDVELLWWIFLVQSKCQNSSMKNGWLERNRFFWCFCWSIVRKLKSIFVRPATPSFYCQALRLIGSHHSKPKSWKGNYLLFLSSCCCWWWSFSSADNSTQRIIYFVFRSFNSVRKQRKWIFCLRPN